MSNICVLKRNIDVSKILEQLKQYPEDWGAVRKIDGSHNVVNDYGFPEVEAGILQLIMGAIETPDQYVGDSEICVPTDAYYHHTEIVDFLNNNGFADHSRCGFLSLPVGGHVGTHIDVGNYYLTRDRFHLSIQGTYRYMVGDEFVDVEPGTLLVFNNKVEHGTINLGDEVRITFVFDVPQQKWDKKLYPNYDLE